MQRLYQAPFSPTKESYERKLMFEATNNTAEKRLGK